MSRSTVPVVDLRYYSTLEIKLSATREEIKKSYRRLALPWHPDECPAADIDATEKFQKVPTSLPFFSVDIIFAKY